MRIRECVATSQSACLVRAPPTSLCSLPTLLQRAPAPPHHSTSAQSSSSSSGRSWSSGIIPGWSLKQPAAAAPRTQSPGSLTCRMRDTWTQTDICLCGDQMSSYDTAWLLNFWLFWGAFVLPGKKKVLAGKQSVNRQITSASIAWLHCSCSLIHLFCWFR